MKELDPLYELLATIVHTNYIDDVHAIKEEIPEQIAAVLFLFESLPIEEEQREEMKEGVMWYMYENRRFFDNFNTRNDYLDAEYLPIIIDRFQKDTERTRIYIELWEKDKETKTDYLALDF